MPDVTTPDRSAAAISAEARTAASTPEITTFLLELMNNQYHYQT